MKILLFLLLIIGTVEGNSLTSNDFLMENYSDIAISTDLEPDDVLALKVIFENAQTLNKFPIKLLIIGEGNVGIKKLRMEALLKEFLLPSQEISIKIVEGKSTNNNIFPLDGQEFFEPSFLDQFPYQEIGYEEASEALSAFVKQAEKPLIIQLKPAQELFQLSLDKELASKTSVIFYGSFNLRRTIQDEMILAHPLFRATAKNNNQALLQKLVDHFSQNFDKLAIAEAFAVMGPEGSVIKSNSWSLPIIDEINGSSQPFFDKFRLLVKNWNKYLFEQGLQESKVLMLQIDETDSPEQIDQQLAELKGNISFLQLVQPATGLQFTLADVLVAGAVSDGAPLFNGSPSDITVNEKGFLIPKEDPTSNLFYYSKIDKEKLAKWLVLQMRAF